jgi:hypothetical protein
VWGFALAKVGALARLGLARALVASGDAAKARTAYQDFFALWKVADPDIFILKQARVREVAVAGRYLCRTYWFITEIERFSTIS